MQKQPSTLSKYRQATHARNFHNFNAILGEKNSTPLPSSLDSDNIPQAFSEYFITKIITIRNNFPPLNPTVSMDKTTYSGKLLQTFTPVTEQFVLEILRKAVPKSCDLDTIPTKLYENLDVLLPTITNIINTSLASVLYHQTSKLLLSNPCYKIPRSKCTEELPSNLKPAILSKILEKVVLHQLLAHLHENNLCNPFKSAYRTGHST